METLQPDVVLAQEAIKPYNLADHGALIGPPGSRYGWGTWVAVFGGRLGLDPVQRLPISEYIAPDVCCLFRANRL